MQVISCKGICRGDLWKFLRILTFSCYCLIAIFHYEKRPKLRTQCKLCLHLRWYTLSATPVFVIFSTFLFQVCYISLYANVPTLSSVLINIFLLSYNNIHIIEFSFVLFSKLYYSFICVELIGSKLGDRWVLVSACYDFLWCYSIFGEISCFDWCLTGTLLGSTQDFWGLTGNFWKQLSINCSSSCMKHTQEFRFSFYPSFDIRYELFIMRLNFSYYKFCGGDCFFLLIASQCVSSPIYLGLLFASYSLRT